MKTVNLLTFAELISIVEACYEIEFDNQLVYPCVTIGDDDTDALFEITNDGGQLISFHEDDIFVNMNDNKIIFMMDNDKKYI